MRLQEYYGFHWNEIGRCQCLGDEVIYHFQRQQDQPLPMTFQVRSTHTDEIVKEFLPPHHCSGWRSCKGQGKVVFAGQCDIADDPDHLVRPSGSTIHWQPVWVMNYDGLTFRFIKIPDTDVCNEFYSVVYNPTDNCFYAGETEWAHGGVAKDWTIYPNGGGVWRSPDGLDWTRIWEDPAGRLITVFVLGGSVYAQCANESIYRITPYIEHVLDYTLPLTSCEYTWKGRAWASGLVSFDGVTVQTWKGNLTGFEDKPIYPVGIDNGGNLLIRIASADLSMYTIGRVKEIDGGIEYVADNWINHNAVHTTGGCVSRNSKLYLGLVEWEARRSVYGCLDVLPLEEIIPKYKLTFTVREAE